MNILDIVLPVFARDQLKLIALLSRYTVRQLLKTLDLDVRLGLLGALDGDETWTALLIISSFLLNLVPQALLGGVGWYGQLVNLIDLHGWHLVEFERPTDQLELWLGL